MVRFTISDEARKLHEESLVVDMHVDTLLVNYLFGFDMTRKHRNPLPGSPLFYQADLPRMEEGGVDVIGFGLVLNPLTRTPESCMRKVKKQVDYFHQVAGAHPDKLYLAGESKTIDERRGKGIGGVLGIEGAHALGGRLEYVKKYYEMGVRYLTLSHFSSNETGNPAQGWGNWRASGLTSFGRDVVKEMGRLGMILDLAHINKAGFMDAAKLTDRPFIVSHTGFKSVVDSSRNIDDEQLRAVADAGGVAGIIFAPFWTGKGKVLETDAEAICDSICYVMDEFGADHVGIGSDIDGFLWRLNVGIEDISSMPVITELLLRRGKKPEDIKKVLGENFLRVFQGTEQAAG